VGVNVPKDSEHLELLFEVYLPLAAGPDQIVPLPLAQLSFDIDKVSAVKFADDIKENAEKLTQKPIVATDLQAVEKAADKLDDMTKGKIQS
jgi:hypothetical protein